MTNECMSRIDKWSCKDKECKQQEINMCPINVYAEMDVVYEDNEVVVFTLSSIERIKQLILKIVRANGGYAYKSLFLSCLKGIIGENRLSTILDMMVDEGLLFRDHSGLYMLPEKKDELKTKRRKWWVYWATHLYFYGRKRW